MSKVLEKIIYNKIIKFVSKSISSSQFRALKVRSTIQQLYSLHQVINSTTQTDVIYLNTQKAFTVFLTVSCLLNFGLLELLVVSGDGSNDTYLAGLKLSELTMFYLLPYRLFLEFPREVSSEYNVELQNLF